MKQISMITQIMQIIIDFYSCGQRRWCIFQGAAYAVMLAFRTAPMKFDPEIPGAPNRICYAYWPYWSHCALSSMCLLSLRL